MALLDCKRRRTAWLVLATGFCLTGMLLLVPSAFSDEEVQGSSRSKLRKDPHYARLYHDGKEFLALPAEQQEAMRKLHDDLERLVPSEREYLMDVLKRYADWLDRLPAADRRKVINTPDESARLQVIKDLREREWVARQPKATQQYLAKLPKSREEANAALANVVALRVGPPRPARLLAAAALTVAKPAEQRLAAIKRLKKEESSTASKWVIAGRHWQELTVADPKRPPLPTQAADFKSAEVETFVKDYLIPVLSKEEKDRLEKAEGHWPDYPITLVELADRHPLALPQRNGPTSWTQLSAGVKGSIKGKKQGFEPFYAAKKKEIEARLAKIPVRNPTESMKFACAVVMFAHSGKKGPGVKIPHELWASKPADMAGPMKAFLDKQSQFWMSLLEPEQFELIQAEGNWPEYPLKVQELAIKHGFKPPWYTLPNVGNKSDLWEKYRVKPLNK